MNPVHPLNLFRSGWKRLRQLCLPTAPRCRQPRPRHLGLEVLEDRDVPASVNQLSPASVVAGNPGITVTVTGSKFNSGDVVLWNGGALPTKFLSSTQLQATLPGNLLATPSRDNVSVLDAGAISNAFPFLVQSPPPPSILRLTPSRVSEGSGGATLVLSGANYGADSLVLWNGNALATTLVSSQQLQAAVPSFLLAHEGVAIVQVMNQVGAAQQFSGRFPLALSEAQPQVRAHLTGFKVTPKGTVVTISGSFSDLASEGHHVRIAWSDGTVTILNYGANVGSTFRVSHTFKTALQNVLAYVNVRDDVGSTSSLALVRLLAAHTATHGHRKRV
jgi:hypothetical protein